MADEDKSQKEKKHSREQPAEPRSPGAAIGAEHLDMPGEGGLPRREDMGPADHRAHIEEEEEGEDQSRD